MQELDLGSMKRSEKKCFKLDMIQNALGDYWQVPVMVAQGKEEGPVLGVTAALHGNELNGISVIHKLWHSISAEKLKGTLIFVPVLNVPGFLMGRREFTDGRDLNRIMPGRENGNSAEVFAYAIAEKLLKKLDYLIDIHTASFGRINSLYVRADLSCEQVASMAELQEPQIIVNKPGDAGTLRGEATKLNIPAITVEVGDPYLFQRKHIRPSIFGLKNVIADLGMIPEPKGEIENDAIICRESYWVYANKGGILQVHPGLTDTVKKGEHLATITDIFGHTIEKVYACEDAIVVAKSTNPVCQVGARVIHLGVIWENYVHS